VASKPIGRTHRPADEHLRAAAVSIVRRRRSSDIIVAAGLWKFVIV